MTSLKVGMGGFVTSLTGTTKRQHEDEKSYNYNICCTVHLGSPTYYGLTILCGPQCQNHIYQSMSV